MRVFSDGWGERRGETVCAPHRNQISTHRVAGAHFVEPPAPGELRTANCELPVPGYFPSTGYAGPERGESSSRIPVISSSTISTPNAPIAT